MSHLISTGRRRGATGVGNGLSLGVPGYAHPLVAPTEWAELTRLDGSLDWAVLNIDRGPGVRPDGHCLEAAGRLTNRAAVARENFGAPSAPVTSGRVLGHLDLRFGTRPFGELVSDAHRFLEWYKVDGFYLGRCPGDRSGLSEVGLLTATLRAVLEGAHIVAAHGVHPCEDYTQLADQLVTFAGPWARYRWSQAAEWTAAHPPERFCHLVHGVPRAHLEEAMRVARWQGAATVFFTDRSGHGGHADAWEALPGYWDDIVSRIGPGVSE